MATEQHLAQLPIPNDYQPPRAVSYDEYLRLEHDLLGKCEYLILDNRRAQATLLQKGDNGVWSYLVFSSGTTIPLATIGLNLPVDQLYDGITLDPDATSERERS